MMIYIVLSFAFIVLDERTKELCSYVSNFLKKEPLWMETEELFHTEPGNLKNKMENLIKQWKVLAE